MGEAHGRYRMTQSGEIIVVLIASALGGFLHQLSDFLTTGKRDLRSWLWLAVSPLVLPVGLILVTAAILAAFPLVPWYGAVREARQRAWGSLIIVSAIGIIIDSVFLMAGYHIIFSI